MLQSDLQRMTSPFNAGYFAAKAGLPSSDCPHLMPDHTSKGDDYPGDWVNWMSGWCAFMEFKGKRTKAERAKMCSLIARSL